MAIDSFRLDYKYSFSTRNVDVFSSSCSDQKDDDARFGPTTILQTPVTNSVIVKSCSKSYSWSNPKSPFTPLTPI